jgi:acetolactate synthase-1/2/3 large subunit
MLIPVSKLIVNYMEKLGVEYAFGIPGSHILPVFDSLLDSKIRCILTKHEQGAAFMAGGYTKYSGKIAACVTTGGPGATNLATGIANAYSDRIPLLAITAEAPTYIFGKGGLQESSGQGGTINQTLLFHSMTRYNRIVERSDYLPQILKSVSNALLCDNPGPVLLSFPFNIQSELVDETIATIALTQKHHPCLKQRAFPINEFVQLIQESRYPMIIAGYGCIASGASKLILTLCHKLNIPIVTSIKGRGVVSEHDAISLGSLGVTSDGIAYKYIVEKADLLIFLGVSFNERTSYVWDSKLIANKKIIQVDHNDEQLEKAFVADLAILGDITSVVEGVVKEAYTIEKKDPTAVEAYKKIKTLISGAGNSVLARDKFEVVERFYYEFEKRFAHNVVIFDDNIIFAQNFYNIAVSGSYFPNTGFSSIGHAVPAAVGAKFATDKPVFALLGDGGFQMCCMELMTAVNYATPITVVVFNNNSMGLIRKNQYQHYQGRMICNEFINPDYRYLAQSFNIAYYKIATVNDVPNVFDAIDINGSINLIEMILDKDAFPDYLSTR